MSTVSNFHSRHTMRRRVHFLAVTAMLSAVAFILQYLEFPLPFMPGFIKLDFSDMPALLGTFALGPVCGIMIVLLKNVLHSAVSQSFGIGEISNALLGSVFAGVAGVVYLRHKTRAGAFWASFSGALAMALFSFPCNLYLVYPIYYHFMAKEVIIAAYQLIVPSVNSIAQCLLLFNVPFTFMKGMIDVIITMVIYKKISPILHGYNR